MADWNDHYSSFDWETPENSDMDTSLEEGDKRHIGKKRISLNITSLKANNDCSPDQSVSFTKTDKSERRLINEHQRSSDHVSRSFTNQHKRRQHRDEHHMSSYSVKDRQDSNRYVNRDRQHHKDRREVYDDRKDRGAFQTPSGYSTNYNNHFKRNARGSIDEKTLKSANFLKDSPIFTRAKLTCIRQDQELSYTSSFRDIRSQIGKTINDSPVIVPSSLPTDSQMVSRSVSEFPRQSKSVEMVTDKSMNVSIDTLQQKQPFKEDLFDRESTSNRGIEVRLNSENESPATKSSKNIVIEMSNEIKHKVDTEHRDVVLKNKSLVMGFHNSSHLNIIDCVPESQNISISSITTDDHDRGSPFRQMSERKPGTNSRISVVFSNGTKLENNKDRNTHAVSKQHRRGTRGIKNDNSVILLSPRSDNDSTSLTHSNIESSLKAWPSPGTRGVQAEPELDLEKLSVKPIQINTKPKININNENDSLNSTTATAKISIKINTSNGPSNKPNNQVDPPNESSMEPPGKNFQKIMVIFSNEEPIYSDFRSLRVNIPPAIWRIT